MRTRANENPALRAASLAVGVALATTLSMSAFAQDTATADPVPESAVAAAEEQAAAAKADPADNDAVTKEQATKATETAAAARAAADAEVKKAEAAESEAKRLSAIVAKRGFWWNKSLNVGVSSSVLFSDAVVGQVDGFTVQGGLLLNGGVNLGYNGFELRNVGKINESLISTPAIGSWALDDFRPVFLKAADIAEWESLALYTYPGFPYLGPYGRFKASTQILPGYTYFADSATVRNVPENAQSGAGDAAGCGPKPAEGSEINDAYCTSYKGGTNADRVGLTNIIEPLILEQALGAIILPPAFPPWVDYKFQAGVGSRQIVARDFFGVFPDSGGYVLDDNADTPETELRQLYSVLSAGAEAEAQVKGSVFDNVGWNFRLGLFYPVAAYSQPNGAYFPGFTEGKKEITAPIGLGPVQFENALLGPLHVDFESLVSLKLLEWLTINWSNRLRREPFVLTNFQFQSQLLVSVGYSLF